MSPLELPRLYPILDVDAAVAQGRRPLDLVDAWLEGGVRFWQFRAKAAAGGAFLELLDEATARTHRVGGRVIVNDRMDLALLAGADGVHLGQTDLSAEAVRPVAPDAFIVGRSTHSDRQVADACHAPIAYLAIGPVFATETKLGATDPAVGLAGVRAAADRAAEVRLPVVAIGGITLERAPAVLAAGAWSVAVISDLLRGEPGERVRDFARAVESLPL